jgi:hypothetical protein
MKIIDPEKAPVGMLNKGWIGVDLDGCLAKYDKWVSIDHIGEPITPMVERVKRWLREGREVRIFTARVWCPRQVRPHGKLELPGLEELRAKWTAIEPLTRPQPQHNEFLRWVEAELSHIYIKRWCKEHIGIALAVTNIKDPFMAELWDDRCVQVEPNTGRAITDSRKEAGDSMKFS